MEDNRLKRKDWPTKITKLTDEEELLPISPAEGIAMMWQLACDAWAFKIAGENRNENQSGEGNNAEFRFQRHIVNIVRPQNKDISRKNHEP